MHDGSISSDQAWHGQDALRSWLVDNTFRLGLVLGASNACNWRAYRTPSLLASPMAEAVTKYHQLSVNPYADVVEVDLTGEIGGVRYRVVACGLSADALPQALPMIESRLMHAWNALAEGFPVSSA